MRILLDAALVSSVIALFTAGCYFIRIRLLPDQPSA